MDINAKKVEIIQHIVIIQKPESIRKIDQFIRDLEYEDDDGHYHKSKDESEASSKKGFNRANVIGSKIKGMLNMYDK